MSSEGGSGCFERDIGLHEANQLMKKLQKYKTRLFAFFFSFVQNSEKLGLCISRS